MAFVVHVTIVWEWGGWGDVVGVRRAPGGEPEGGVLGVATRTPLVAPGGQPPSPLPPTARLPRRAPTPSVLQIPLSVRTERAPGPQRSEPRCLAGTGLPHDVVHRDAAGRSVLRHTLPKPTCAGSYALASE